MYTILEVIAVALSLTFLILLIQEVKWCWPFGITSSALSIVLFVEAKLYSEAILYFFYAVIGFYGWWVWTRRTKKEVGQSVKKISRSWSALVFAAGLLGAWGLGTMFSKVSDAAHPFIDATTTSFSFVASFLEAHKILSAWIYWIGINGVSVWLYFERGLPIYSALMIIYFAVSIYGWFDWKKKWARAAI
ncbi:MAG: nicotinamide riboside transporter PnuC [Cryomorphaceae bacterium]